MPFPLTNLLFETLPTAEQASLRTRLEPVALPVNTILFEPDELPRYLYFVTSGFASVVLTMSTGDAVEVGVVGREGFAGSSNLIGSQRGLARCLMQIGGTGLRIDTRHLEEHFAHHASFHRLVLQHAQYENLMLTQLSACNRVHEVEERLARWLLMVSDRIGEPDLRLTQEFLGQMLGTRRSTVTVTAGALQRSGLIEYTRGHVKIIDRESLETVACECYPVTQKLFQNLYRDPLPRNHLAPTYQAL